MTKRGTVPSGSPEAEMVFRGCWDQDGGRTGRLTPSRGESLTETAEKLVGVCFKLP